MDKLDSKVTLDVTLTINPTLQYSDTPSFGVSLFTPEELELYAVGTSVLAIKTITFEVPEECRDVRELAISSLKKSIQAEKAESHTKIHALEEKIRELLTLPSGE